MIEARRKIHIHVADDIGLAVEPRLAQRAPAASLSEIQKLDLGMCRREFRSHVPSAIGRAVIDNHDLPSATQTRVQEGKHGLDALPEYVRLVENRYDQIHGKRVVHRPRTAMPERFTPPAGGPAAAEKSRDQITKSTAPTKAKTGSGETPAEA